MEAKVYSVSGKASSAKANLSDEVFGIEPNNHAIYLDVKQHLANRRQGTHKSKERNEIAGSTKKLKKQKGTGGARAGSSKSGTRVGGGRIFGPRPRNYSFKLNVKLKRLARKSAFSYQMKNDALMVLEDVKMDAIKTKDFVSMVSALSFLSGTVEENQPFQNFQAGVFSEIIGETGFTLLSETGAPGRNIPYDIIGIYNETSSKCTVT